MESYSSLSIEELVQRCAASKECAAWQEFVRRLHRLIAKVVLRTAVRLGDGAAGGAADGVGTGQAGGPLSDSPHVTITPAG